MKVNEDNIVQAHLSVLGNGMPQVVLLPKQKPGEGRAANLVPLPGAYFDKRPNITENDAWEVTQKLRDLCAAGDDYLNTIHLRNAYQDHLAHAYMVLCDCLRLFDDDWTISKETFETMLRGSIEKIVAAGKCFGFHLENYRSDPVGE